MIPVALPSVETLLLLAFLLATTLVWGIWTVVLVASIRRRPLGAPDDAALWSGDRHCDFTLWQFGNFYLQMRAYDREMASSYRPELGEPVRLGQIDMPKGTKL